MKLYRLTCAHTHNGVGYLAGDPILLNDTDAAYLFARRIVAVPMPSPTATDLSEARHTAALRQKTCCF